MLTFVQFSSEWKRLHRPSMNVDGDVAFFYDIYAYTFLAALYGEYRCHRA